jgi:tetratricopeptide (TPR) repeat protein
MNAGRGTSGNRMKHANDPGPRSSSRTGSRRYETSIVVVLAVVLAALWILSLAGVRARMATRAWDNGDIAGAYRLAAMATRQRPEMADMWLLQARCEEQLRTPCDAALSYARAVLAAGEQQARHAGASTASSPGVEATPVAHNALGQLRNEALAAALRSAAGCPSITSVATVFEALTVGLPSDPEQRDGYWPGEPEITGTRETPASLAAALPEDATLRLRWIEFLWRRGEQNAARAAAQSLLVGEADVPADGLSMLGRILLDVGDHPAAVQAFRRALEVDSGWVPATAAAAALPESSGIPSTELPPRLPAGQQQPAEPVAEDWDEQRLPLDGAAVEASAWQLRDADLLLATNGSVSFTLAAGADQRRFVLLEIRGTPANGRYPEVTPSVNGTAGPSFEATESGLPIVLEVPAGSATATVSFAFDNDWADESGDRNVFFGMPTLYFASR